MCSSILARRSGAYGLARCIQRGTDFVGAGPDWSSGVVLGNSMTCIVSRFRHWSFASRRQVHAVRAEITLGYCLSMISSENRFALFRIML
jgi:hypothetical protein